MRPMDLHPLVRSVICYERPLDTGRLCAADARLLFVVSGGIVLTLGEGEERRLSGGSCAYIPRGHAYAVRCDYARLIVVAFDPVATEGTAAEPIAPVRVDSRPGVTPTPVGLAPFDTPFILEEFGTERDTLLSLTHAFREATPYARAHVSARFTSVLLRAAELCDEQALPSRLVEHLDAYIREHADEEISNTELGALFGYHPFYISQLLKKRRGITLHQYILSYKLATAADRLRYSDASVAEIAASLGFADPSYFTKSFKAAYGTTPKAYRKEHATDLI